MPGEKVQYLPKKHVLTFEEIERLVNILASMGISKVRLTGGEPFVRTDLMKLIRNIFEIPGIRDVNITTNGVLTAPHIPELKRLGVASVNLSLDTLDRKRFKEITLRDDFEAAYKTLQLLLENEIPVKINAVVMEDKNIEDILPLAELARSSKVHVRFIEQMPFNGKGEETSVLNWNYRKILKYLEQNLGPMKREDDEPFSTSSNYKFEGYSGTVGVIPAFSRTFCGTCNRIRITPQGDLKTCLYDGGVLNLRDLMREGKTDDELKEILLKAFSQRPANGFEAEQLKASKHFESMSIIGG